MDLPTKRAPLREDSPAEPATKATNTTETTNFTRRARTSTEHPITLPTAKCQRPNV